MTQQLLDRADVATALPASKARAVSAKRVKTSKPAKVAKKATGEPKYHDGTGRTWAGSGKRPAWFVEALAEAKTPEPMLIGRTAA